MMESVEEPVEVLARFDRGQVMPFRFRWNQTVFRIAKVTSAWEDRDGQYRRCHFAILAESGDYFELRFQVQDFRWILSRTSIGA
jgi:hypothetical protein